MVHIVEPTPPPRLTGHADLRTRPDFAELLHALCAQATGDVHLDLAELDFVDVSGAMTLLSAAHALGEGHLVLHNPPASLRRVLHLLGPSVAEAGVRLDPPEAPEQD